MSKTSENERSAFRGLGAASAASAVGFLTSILLVEFAVNKWLVCAFTILIAVLSVFQLITDSFKDFGMRVLLYLTLNAAYGLLHYRVGYIRYILRITRENEVLRSDLKLLLFVMIGMAAFSVIYAAVVIAIGRNRKGYLQYIAKIERSQHNFSIYSIAASLCCMVVSSMIYG